MAVLSFEIFPPKKGAGFENVETVVKSFVPLNPESISITCGAGGGIAAGSENTDKIAAYIENELKIKAVAHVTCIGSKKADILARLKYLKENNVKRILALRGDKNPEKFDDKDGDFRYAGELISFIKTQKEYDDFEIYAACYPEVHSESANAEEDIKFLKQKTDCGVKGLYTQLFFDNEKFFDFTERARKANINVPLHAGIMPVTSANQITKMVQLSGASLPAKFSKLLAKYQDNPLALKDAGINYATEQITGLLAEGVEGIHLYTMNKPEIAERITNSLKNMI